MTGSDIRTLGICLCFFCSILGGKGQPIDSLEFPSDSLLIDLPVYEVRASPIKLDMPAPFMRVPLQNLRREEGLSLEPVLNRVPGLYMQSGALNTNRITLRGIGSRSPYSTTRIRTYLDDIPLTGGDGVTSLEDIDLSLFETIEVWKGPSASIYGAGLGGMIHLRLPEIPRDSFLLRSQTVVGSFGLLRQTLGLEVPDQEKTSFWRINSHLTYRDGFRENSDFSRKGLAVLGRNQINPSQSLTTFVQLVNLQAHIPSSINRQDFLESPQQAAAGWKAVNGREAYDRWMAGLSHQFLLVERGRWNLKSHASLSFQGRNALEVRPFNILEEESLGKAARLTLSLSDTHLPGALFPALSLGAEFFQEDFYWKTFEQINGNSGSLLSNNAEDRRYLNLFVQSFYQLNQAWSIFLGLNRNTTTYTYTDRFFADSLDLSGTYGFAPVYSPRMGVTYQFLKSFSVFGTISHGFAAPTLAETLRPDGLINPDIQAEKGWNFEIGSRGFLGNRLRYEISLYRMYIRDLLVAERVGPDQFVGRNAGASSHEGLEVYADAEIGSYLVPCQVYLTYTYANYRFRDFVDAGNDYAGNRLPGTAPHQLTAGVAVQFPFNLELSGHWIYVSKRPLLDDNSLYDDPYSRLDLKAAYRLAFKRFGQFHFFGGIRNGFEPATSRPPDVYSNRAELHPEINRK